MPPGGLCATKARVKAADHIAVSAAQFTTIGEGLKRELAAALDQITGGAAVDAGAAGVALGEVDDVAVSRGISSDHG